MTQAVSGVTYVWSCLSFRFGMQSVNRVVHWIVKEISEKATPILDLGCGNGMVLLKLVSCTLEYAEI